MPHTSRCGNPKRASNSRVNGRLHSRAKSESALRGRALRPFPEAQSVPAERHRYSERSLPELEATSRPPAFGREIFGPYQASLRQQHRHERDNACMNMKHRHRIEEPIPSRARSRSVRPLREGEKPFSRREPVVVRDQTALWAPGRAGRVENRRPPFAIESSADAP